MLQKVIFSFVLSMIFSVTLLPGQVSESLYEAQLDSLKAAFPNCHVEAEELETAFFCALSFYPEFKDASIVVRYGKVSSSMLCRPEPVSVFSKGRIQNPGQQKPVRQSFSTQCRFFGPDRLFWP